MNVIAVEIPIDAIIRFSVDKPIKRLLLFGSVLRDDFTNTSDVDILVEFDSDANVTYFDIAAYEAELTEIIGRTVDMRTPGELSRYFVKDVLQKTVTLYERE